MVSGGQAYFKAEYTCLPPQARLRPEGERREREKTAMEKNIYKVLGDSVRACRTRAGWSQEELGERAGLHPSYIGQIERCVKKISIATLQKLSAALKVKISDLLQEKSFPAAPSSWEVKLTGIIRDRPAEQQGFAYRIVKEALRPHPRRRK